MAAEILLPCAKLDGTDARTCHHKGPYALDRNRPSHARVVRMGDYNDSKGPHTGVHLRCIPTEFAFVERQKAENSIPSGNTPEFRRKLYDDLVEEQQGCSKYISRG